MGRTTGIEWADSTVNLATGCTKVSRECDKCYMFRIRESHGLTTVFMVKSKDSAKKAIKQLGKKPRRVFLNSMSDTFHPSARDDLIQNWFEWLEETPHTYIILTKRAGRLRRFAAKYGLPRNSWVGVSVGERAAYHRVKALQKVEHHTKFLSLEPMLESLHDVDLTGIRWVIVGGESDYVSPRPFDESWAREIRDRCYEDGALFFYKQSGGSRRNEEGVWGTDFLDGRQHHDAPGLYERPTLFGWCDDK